MTRPLAGCRRRLLHAGEVSDNCNVSETVVWKRELFGECWSLSTVSKKVGDPKWSAASPWLGPVRVLYLSAFSMLLHDPVDVSEQSCFETWFKSHDDNVDDVEERGVVLCPSSDAYDDWETETAALRLPCDLRRRLGGASGTSGNLRSPRSSPAVNNRSSTRQSYESQSRDFLSGGIPR